MLIDPEDLCLILTMVSSDFEKSHLSLLRLQSWLSGQFLVEMQEANALLEFPIFGGVGSKTRRKGSLEYHLIQDSLSCDGFRLRGSSTHLYSSWRQNVLSGHLHTDYTSSRRLSRHCMEGVRVYLFLK